MILKEHLNAEGEEEEINDMCFWDREWGDRDPMPHAQILPAGVWVKEEQWKKQNKRNHGKFFNLNAALIFSLK